MKTKNYGHWRQRLEAVVAIDHWQILWADTIVIAVRIRQQVNAAQLGDSKGDAKTG